ncbi:MAG: hypothetical protein J7456_09040 [Chloroflexus sp.]|nr:hypothetical protein [Chloroflexus sp.]
MRALKMRWNSVLIHSNPDAKAYLVKHRNRCFSRLPDSFGSYHTVEKKTVALLHEHIGALNLTGAVTGIMDEHAFSGMGLCRAVCHGVFATLAVIATSDVMKGKQ